MGIMGVRAHVAPGGVVEGLLLIQTSEEEEEEGDTKMHLVGVSIN